jgi:hypothetical protein
MKKHYFLSLIFWACCFQICAQSEIDNLNKYWAYRDRLRKNFLKVGSDQGESIPMSARSIGFPYSGSDASTSRVYWQDATIYLGHYLSLMATEIKLLLNSYNTSTNSEEKQNILLQLEQSKNELYFAIQAVNRLDKGAEKYLSGTQIEQTGDLNGLILRDDVPFDFYFKFQDDRSPIFNRNCNFVTPDSGHSQTQQYARPTQEQGTLENCYSTEARPAGFHSENQCNNVMSLDQVTSLLSGLVMVHKLVPQGYYYLLEFYGKTKC